MKTKTQGLALRKRKILKIIGARGLAFFMGIGTLCGVLLAPMNSAHATTSGATSASNATNLAGAAQSPDSALTPQEQLLAGTLELDPENDPVIYTTDYGLDIKWHMAGLPNDSNDIAPVPSGQKLATYAYFNHGGVNWVIIGCSNKSTTLSGVLNLSNILEYYYHKAGYYNFSNTTSDIWHYLSNPIDHELEDQLKDIYSLYDTNVYASHSNTISQNAVFPNAQSTNELEHNEVLCFAQNSFSAKSKFNDSTSAGNCYYNSRLMSTMNTFYNSNLTDLHIVEKTLKTVWAGASDTTNGSNLTGTYKIFPLAGANANESFYVLNYLTEGSDAMKQSAYWWLRSGVESYSSNAYNVNAAGGVCYNRPYGVSVSYGVRPAFVLKL